MERPQKRQDCLCSARPCPWIGCKHHLLWSYFDAPQDCPICGKRHYGSHHKFCHKEEYTDRGYLGLHSDEEIIGFVWDMPETCALNLYDKKGMILDEIAKVFRISKERVRQIIDFKGGGALKKARRRLALLKT